MSESAQTPDRHNALAENYSALDRILHRIAFAHPKVQQLLSDVENDLFRKRLEETIVDRPVFISGLPRAGSTLLLEMLFETGEFVSYTYRQMPFVLSPLLWDRITRGSRQQATEQQRAHGDGMSISVDSPEAFEEVLWNNRLSETLFDNGCQRPLKYADLTVEFRDTFRQMLRKMVALAEPESLTSSQLRTHQIRYLSKNNANIACLDALTRLFPDASVLLCFRHPQTHVASLTHQHDRFSRLHEKDAFSRQYMAWTAHHDFGANFVPINFSGTRPGQPALADHRYWLQYWVNAYRHVLDQADDSVTFISYEALLGEPLHTLHSTAEQLELRSPQRLAAQASRIRPGGSRQLDLASVDPRLAAEASTIYEALMVRARRSRSVAPA